MSLWLISCVWLSSLFCAMNWMLLFTMKQTPACSLVLKASPVAMGRLLCYMYLDVYQQLVLLEIGWCCCSVFEINMTMSFLCARSVWCVLAPGQHVPRRGSGYAQHAKRKPAAGGGRPKPSGRAPVAPKSSGSLKRRKSMERAPHMPRGGQKQLANRKSREFNPSFLKVAQPGAGTGHG